MKLHTVNIQLCSSSQFYEHLLTFGFINFFLQKGSETPQLRVGGQKLVEIKTELKVERSLVSNDQVNTNRLQMIANAAPCLLNVQIQLKTL